MRKPAPPRDVPPPLELLCLQSLWSIGEGSVAAVREAVAPRKQLAYTTVMTLLDRLARKGTVTRRKSGRAFIYQAAVSCDTMRRAALREFVGTFFDGSEKALTSFLDGHTAAPNGTAETAHRLDTALL
jgi:predicted transcriptional regulator